MPSIAITTSVDMTMLNASMDLARQYSTRTPQVMVNTAGFFIARAWVRFMPKVPTARMDAELNVSVIPGLTATGRPSKAKKNRIFIGLPGGRSFVAGVPFTVLIMMARARPGSRYNALTGGRYALTQNPFKGVSRAAGAMAMTNAISRMIKGRHSSGGFLASSILPIIKDLEKAVARKYQRGALTPNIGPRMITNGLGMAEPGRPGLFSVCVLTSMVGTAGRNYEAQNKAMWAYGVPAAQRAIDLEADRQIQFVAREQLREMGGRFAAYGTTIEI